MGLNKDNKKLIKKNKLKEEMLDEKRTARDDLQYIAKYPLQYEQLKETTVLVTGATGLSELQ